MRKAIIGLALLGSALSAAHGQVALAPLEGTRLDVSATGESTRIPDLATIGTAVVTEAPTARAALSENNRRMDAVLSALRRAGIAERDIQTSRLGLSPQYDRSNRNEPRIVGYQATNQLSIRFRDIERAGSIVDTLVSVGINQINGPNLSIEEPEEALNEARRDAVRRARQRAELYASAAGMRVARIVSISEAGAARPPVVMAGLMRAEADSRAPLQIAPGEQRLTATVSITFELE